ncbi:MAG: hypothetical protein LBQ42_06735 [Synergistaceae bacterium]|nr:hypothetical protein [Synergistaceae bacterium]
MVTRNEFEQLVDRCIAEDISKSKIYEILDHDREKQWLEGEYIYLENIALQCFDLIYYQSVEDRSGWLLIKQILSGEKSWFFSTTLRISSGKDNLPPKRRWLLDVVHDSEWATLRKLIIQYHETHFLSPDIRGKYWEMAYDKTFETKTIIDLMKKIIYHNISIEWWVEKDTEGGELFDPGVQFGERADPLDFTNKLLRIIDFCEGKTFFIVGVNYLNGQPMISLLS